MNARARTWLAELRTPLGLCLGNRAVLFALAYFGLVLQPTVTHPWRAFPQNLFLDGWFRWDSGWYMRLVQSGYDPIPGQAQQPTNFFPLYPLLVRALTVVTRNPYIAAFLLSNGFLLLACVWLYRLVERAHGERVAARTLLLMLCFPFSYYFSAMYTESLFLVTAVGAFYFADRRRWLAASLCAGAAGATRLVGVVVLMPVALYYLQACGWSSRRVRWNVLWLLVGLAGIGGHMLFLWLRFRAPLAFLSSQWVPGWGNEQTWRAFRELWRSATTWRKLASGAYDGVSLVNVTLALAAVVVCLASARRLGLIWTSWALVTLVASLRIWRASGRYSAVVFPVFVGVALLTDDNEPLFVTLLTGSCLVLALLTYLFSHGAWVC
jgi:hypothetical protein